jgi:monothiol glutaredoxin
MERAVRVSFPSGPWRVNLLHRCPLANMYRNMTRPRPPVHASIAKIQNDFQSDLVEEVGKAIESDKVVVVGVSGLMPGKKARQMLDAQSVPHRYLEYGSYFKGWRRRLALKIWVGWPTFPLVFVKGTFVGGASDLKVLIENGELKKMLAD